MIVALLTDFGTRDHFVASVKGTILSIVPAATIVDISHEIEPHNIAEAAFTLGGCYRDFPKGTIFLAVVDPGVGSSRRAVAVRAAERLFVVPDNGILSFVLDDTDGRYAANELTNSEFLGKTISTTFHGRDVFAHVAGQLANGIEPASFGPSVSDLIIFKNRTPERAGNLVSGEIIHIDRFGNLITNLGRGDLADGFSIEVNGRAVNRLLTFYAEADAGELFAIVGSTGRIEIAVNGDSAKAVTKASVGAVITVTAPTREN
ncbi:MAG: SAM-dependent chlorinase/fluorinase [Acidobacteriota bacterium]